MRTPDPTLPDDIWRQARRVLRELYRLDDLMIHHEDSADQPMYEWDAYGDAFVEVEDRFFDLLDLYVRTVRHVEEKMQRLITTGEEIKE